ncbi:MAG: hypothetical protein ACO263_09665 [Cyclobacteriaceae bacterium]|jgi:hypothetical protein
MNPKVLSVFQNFWNSKFQISFAILGLQIIAVADLMILMELANPSIAAVDSTALSIFDGAASILLAILNARFMYFFLSKKKYYGYVALMVFSIVLTGWVTGIPFSNNYPLEQLVLIVFSTILGYLPPLMAMIYILIDSLQAKDDKVYRLVGAANLFILFPIIFGGILFSLEMVHPMVVNKTFTSLMDAIYFYTKLSFYGATGFESPVENISALLKNALTLESFFMDLFALLMLGRLVEK